MPPPKFGTGSTIIDNKLYFSVFIVIQNEKVFLFSVNKVISTVIPRPAFDEASVRLKTRSARVVAT